MMRGFVDFMVSPAGRVGRVVAGVVLILVGLLVLGGTAGIILAVIGVVPLLAGAFDICIFAPLAAVPFSGKAVRRMSGR